MFSSRFVGLRSFDAYVCRAGKVAANLTCDGSIDAGWTKIITGPADSFPGVNPRPGTQDECLRYFTASPQPLATHVKFVVTNNQCTGQPSFQGDQDLDPANNAECRTGIRRSEVHTAEIEVFAAKPTRRRHARLDRVAATRTSSCGEGRHAPALSASGDMLAAVNVLVVAFAVIAGVAGSVQVAVMAKLGDRVGVFGALAWATSLAALLAVALMLVARQSFGEFAAAARQPVWLWSGALMSIIIVLAITVAGSRIGVIATVSVLLAGQFAAGAAIDRWGLLGAERVGVGWWKIVGILLLGIGAGLTLKR